MKRTHSPHRILVAFVLSAASVPLTHAQPVVVEGPYVSIQVNVDAGGQNVPGDAANEPSLAINPTAPQQMVIGYRQFDSAAVNFKQAGLARSEDGGLTWTVQPVLDPGVQRSDPVLAAGPAGKFYYYSLSLEDRYAYLFDSTDGGLSWYGPRFAHGGDKIWLTVDTTDGAGQGHLYATWHRFNGNYETQVFTRSTDGGRSFEPPTYVPRLPAFGSLTVAADGTLFVVGIDTLYGYDYDRVIVARSTDAQQSSVPATFEMSVVDLGGSFEPYSTPNLFGLPGMLWIDTDRSDGPHSGNVYVLTNVRPHGSLDLGEVHFCRSLDGGMSWSTPARINDDVGGATQWFATMSVAPNGRIDVAWNDTRDSGSPHISRVYYTCSYDGGLSWLPNRPLSPAFDTRFGFDTEGKLGDYYHMLSTPNAALLAYAATFNGEQDVYFLRIPAPDAVRGDLDCDGIVSESDIDPFVCALVASCDYAATVPACERLRADCNLDGRVNAADIDPFVGLLLRD